MLPTPPGNEQTPATGPASLKYHLVSRIGTGGMAEVFLTLMQGPSGAMQPAVIKRLWPELARDRDFVDMFLHEARLSLRLQHPNVCEPTRWDGTTGAITSRWNISKGRRLVRFAIAFRVRGDCPRWSR